MKFDPIDMFLLAGLCFSMYLGYRGGLTKKLLNILALIGSIVLATKLLPGLGSFITDTLFVPDPYGNILGFASVIIVIMTATILVYRRLASYRTSTMVSQISGALLGAFEGAVLISLVLLMLKLFEIPDQSTRTESLLYKPLVNLTPTMFDRLHAYLPEASDFKAVISKQFEKYHLFDENKGAEAH
jgi:membrane protein required for colicin V production